MTAVWIDVNEAHLLLYGEPATREWWELFRLRFKNTARITVRSAGFPGDRVRIDCDNSQHAESLHTLMADRGVPKAALKIGGA